MFFVPAAKEMERWQIRRTPRGIRLIDAKGYTYTKDRHVGSKSYWRCDHRSWKCKARASLIGVTQSGDYSKAHVMFNLTSHGHAPAYRKKRPKESSDTDVDLEDSLLGVKSPVKSAEFEKRSTNKSSIPKTQSESSESEMCLRWNSHHSNMSTVIPALMDDEKYVDVTLMCEGKTIKCHKLILSSCSEYFDEMLKNTTANMQTIIFLRDIKFWQMKALIDFMYKGEVNIDQSKLEPLLKAAEDLQIKGLAGKQSKKDQEEDKKIMKSQCLPSAAGPENVKKEKEDDYVDHAMLDDDEEYFPYSECKKKMKKNRKRKIATPPDPSSLKHVKINLRGTKSRPNIKQPKFYSPDYPEYDRDRSVSPPKLETDSLFHIDNIKLEPIDIEVPQSPNFIEMSTMMDKSISETNKDTPKVAKEIKVYGKRPVKVENKINIIERGEIQPQPSTSKESIEKASDTNEEPSIEKIPNTEVLNLNKKAIILKCQNVKQLINDNPSIQKILDGATLSDSEKSKLPQIRVRNLPTTDTVLKKFATTQLTSILKRDGAPNKHIILTKVAGTKPTILRQSIPKITKEFTTEIQEANVNEIAEKISLLAKTKKELGEKLIGSKETEEKSDDDVIADKTIAETSKSGEQI